MFIKAHNLKHLLSPIPMHYNQAWGALTTTQCRHKEQARPNLNSKRSGMGIRSNPAVLALYKKSHYLNACQIDSKPPFLLFKHNKLPPQRPNLK